MSKISSSLEQYVDELRDIWFANGQMALVLCKVTPQAQNPKLQSMLKVSQADIAKHTEIVKSLIEAKGEVAIKKNLKEMDGLEAKKINRLKFFVSQSPRPARITAAAGTWSKAETYLNKNDLAKS